MFRQNTDKLTGIFTIFLIIAISYVSPSYAQDEKPYYLSLQSALLFSLHESSELKIVNEQRLQNQYSVDEAKASYYPDVQFLAETGFEYNNPATFEDRVLLTEKSDTTNSYDVSLTLRQMLFDRPKTVEVLRRKQLVDSKEIEVLLTEEDVIEETFNRYLDVFQAQQDVAAADEMLSYVQAAASKMKTAYEGGAESQANFNYATARLSLAESKYNSALASYKEATSQLTALTGGLPDFLVTEPSELSIDDYDLSFYQHLAAKKNNELQLINSNLKATELDYKKQKGAYLPSVNFVMEVGQSHDRGGDIGNIQDASAMVQMRYDIFKGFGRHATTNRVASRIRELEYEKEDLVKEITSNIKTAYYDIEATRANINSKIKEAESYVSLRNIAGKSLEAGEINLIENIETEEKLFEANSQIYSLQADLYRQSYSLLKLIGALKKDKFCESC